MWCGRAYAQVRRSGARRIEGELRGGGVEVGFRV